MGGLGALHVGAYSGRVDRRPRILAPRGLPGEIMSDHEKTSRFYGILIAIVVVDLWILPIRSSFWLDETATFWVIKDGLANLLQRSMDWAGQSPLYYLTAWLALAAGGRHEWVLRLPSLIALTIAAWLLVRWLDTGFARYAAGDHYLFGPVLVVIAFYAVWRALHE